MVNVPTILYHVVLFLLIAGEVYYRAAVHPDQCHIDPVLSTNLQSFSLPGGIQHGAQVTRTCVLVNYFLENA